MSEKIISNSRWNLADIKIIYVLIALSMTEELIKKAI
jgi:hypothetical protein